HQPPAMIDLQLSRRSFLSAAALLAPALFRQPSRGDSRFVAEVPLVAPGASTPPFGQLLGEGLDARLFTDLSQLGNPQSAVRNPQSALATRTDRFFVRTAFPSTLARTDPWTIHIGGLVATPLDVALRDLEASVAPPVRVLLECSGNADESNYGL